MKRIAIIGGGISGLTAAYELELARKRGADIDWHLYEASNRLGGIIETTRIATPEGEFILEGGPDGWVTEKPWARDLAIELGLESELIYSNDATRKAYILKTSEAGNDLAGKLQPIPDRMRMMIPEDLGSLDDSPLFSDSAKQAYANEFARAGELKAQAPTQDESVASFVRRHFGDEVLNTLAAPLLSGVFGGDVHKLSVRAVMPQFVAMEREHGSLIAALQSKSKQRGHVPKPIFTSLRNGMASLVDALTAHLPSERITREIEPWPLEDGGWRVLAGKPDRKFLCFTGYRTRSAKDIAEGFDHIIVATPLDVTRSFTGPTGIDLKTHLPTDASSAILVALAWTQDLARTFSIPSGFGFLVPQEPVGKPQLLACTFVDQKFPHRAPEGARVMRAFFGGKSAEALATQSDDAIATTALTQLRDILGPLPEPELTNVRRCPRSLPQYEVGHLDRIAELERLIRQVPGLHLLGNSYRGVGIPDLIRDARATARAIANN